MKRAQFRAFRQRCVAVCPGGGTSRQARAISRLLPFLLAVAHLAAQTAGNQPAFTFALSGIPFSAIAVDTQGNTYVAGSTISGSVPTTPGAFQTTFTSTTCTEVIVPAPCNAAFVIKLALTGAIVYATYLDGSYGSDAYGVAVDAGASPFNSSGVFQVNVLLPADLPASGATSWW